MAETLYNEITGPMFDEDGRVNTTTYWPPSPEWAEAAAAEVDRILPGGFEPARLKNPKGRGPRWEGLATETADGVRLEVYRCAGDQSFAQASGPQGGGWRSRCGMTSTMEESMWKAARIAAAAAHLIAEGTFEGRLRQPAENTGLPIGAMMG